MDVLGLGQANGGVFSRGEAIRAGESDRTLGLLVRHGVLHRLRRGMYVLAATWAMADEIGRHLLRARAELAAQDGEVALAGASAAALHGFALHDQDLSVVHLIRLDGCSGRRTAKVNQHRVTTPLEVDDTAVRDGVRAITPARSVWEVACRSTLEGGVVTTDSALHQHPGLSSKIAELTEEFAYVPGSRRARIALRLADEHAESPGESVTRVQCYRFGIPAPELQHKIWDSRGQLIARLDFWWEEFRHAGEFDGKIKYGRLLREGQTSSDAVVSEKVREDLVRAEGCGMSRFVWSMVGRERARRSMADLATAMERSRRLYVFGPVVAG